MFETVVIATDGSESAERAVTVALDLADRYDATIHALTVLTEESEQEREPAQTIVDEVAARTASDVRTVVEIGDPASTICAYAEDVDADVIATGTRGRGGPYKFHLGSVAEAVVHNCPVPVLTVRGAESS